MSLPANMKYIDHGQGGPASCLQVKQGVLPQLKSGEVLIEVAYAGVNRPDVLQRAGAYPPPVGASPVLGLEVAGKIVAAADDVRELKIGNTVCALTPGGGYAEYCAAPASNCLPVPKGLSLAEAAALPENYFTVWTNVFDRGRLRAGESFLVHGGAGGIGITAIQLAKAFGATVYTTVTGSDKIDAVKKLGADEAIDYQKQDWAEEIRRLTGKQGLDCILDMVGGEYVGKNLKLLKTNGRLVQIAFMQGSRVELDCMPILTRSLTFTGSTLRPRSIEEKAAIAQALLKNVWPLLEVKKVGTLIHKVYLLEEVQKAHELMESSAHIGKIVLKVI
ncbi:MAG: NAD(P)H-quinone oxidoreductase [Smithellaceae bacterium]|jgi:putative PIG3 family NAD(P)H quinone oxidoreductase